MADPLALALNLPFQEQIDFFRAKLNLPTARWDDIWKGAHDRAFVVAGAMKADLLDDLRQAVSPLQRTTLEAFRKDFKRIVAERGWHGWTGEGTKGGEAWRTKVIFETNVRASHAAGRYRQLTDPDTLAAMPYWRYVHNDSVLHPRPHHQAWHGTTLPAGHDFWKTHFAPNGWNCFPPDVLVRCDARIGLKTVYTGEMVDLTTALGNRLTVTANHPILTRRGWIAAHMLHEGNELIGALGQADAHVVGVVDDEQAPSRAEDLFESLAAQGLRIALMAADDFHGDAQLRKPEVHIAGSDSELVNVIQTALSQQISKRGLKDALHGRVESALVAGGAPLRSPVFDDAVLAQNSADGGLCKANSAGDFGLAGEPGTIKRKYLPFGIRVSGVGDNPGGAKLSLHAARRFFDGHPAQRFGFGLSAQSHASQLQSAPKPTTADALLFSQLLEANPGVVAVDQIVQIRKYEGSHTVYDFVTSTGLIMAGGLLVSNCRCKIVAQSQPGTGDKAQPPEGWDTLNPKTGEQVGIDKGWGYAPGANATTPLREMIDQKLIKLDAGIGAALAEALRPALLADQSQAFAAFIDATLADKVRGKLMIAGALKPAWVDAATRRGIKPETAEIVVRDQDVWHTFRDAKANKLDLAWFKDLPRRLDAPGAVLLDTTHEGAPAFLLVYSASDDAAKLVVRVNYQVKKRGILNIVETGRPLDVEALATIRREIGNAYQLIDGSL